MMRFGELTATRQGFFWKGEPMSKAIRLQPNGRLRLTSILAPRRPGKGRFRRTKSNTLKRQAARKE